MKKLRQDFYDNFDGESIERINAGIIASKSIKLVERYFSEDSTKQPKSCVIEKIPLIKAAIENGDIYKKTIFSYFSDCPKLKVLRAIYKLSDNSRKTLFLFCSLEENSELVEDLGENYYEASNMFRYLLKRIDDILKGKVKFDTFYSLFPDYNKEEILGCMELLTIYEKLLVFKKFGENLDGNGVFMTLKENKIINLKITRKMKKYLPLYRKGYRLFSITDLYPNLTLEELQNYIDLLTPRRKEHFYSIFGEDLKKKRFVPNIESIIGKEYKESLDRVINYNGRKLKPFFEIFESFRKEDESIEDFKVRIIDAVSTLKPYSIVTIKHIYGETFENIYLPDDVTSKEIKYFTSDVVPAIKRRLRKLESENVKVIKRKIKKLRERFTLLDIFYFDSDLYWNYVIYEISMLKKVEKELLRKRFGVNLDESNELNMEETLLVKRIVNKVRKSVYLKISNEIGVSLRKLMQIHYLYDNSIIRESFDDIDIRVIVSVIAYLYIKISADDVYKVLGVNPLEHLESVKSILEEKGIDGQILIKKKKRNI